MIKNILVADDDPDDTLLLCEAIVEIDKSVIYHVTKNGKELLDVLINNKIETPQIVLLDINMPIMDGWSCLLELKKHETYKDIPVIMCSTSIAQADVRKALEYGAFAFYVKPNSYLLLKDFLLILINTESLNKEAIASQMRANGKKHVFYVNVINETGNFITP
jgi:CheY-like chemotaxis protein